MDPKIYYPKEYNVLGDFKHGDNFEIGNFNIIEDGCSFGDNVKIGSFCYIKSGTIVGNNVFIDSYVKTSGNCIIGDNCIVRYNATIARQVTLGDGVFISPNVMTIYSTHERVRKGGTVIGSGAFIGTNAVIGPGLMIAPGTVVGSLAFVDKDIEEPGIYVGIPAKFIKPLKLKVEPENQEGYEKEVLT
jgi:acetyltransferase-like isoleucine patch superfamily enzyme